MGVIKKEGIKQSIVIYIGVLLGAINVLYFYPKYFTDYQLGLFQFLLHTGSLLYPFVSLGAHNLSVRMFPKFKNAQNGHNGLLFLLLSCTIVGYLIFLLVTYFSTNWIDGLMVEKSLLIQENWYYIIPLSGLMILSIIFTQYILNFKKVLIPSIANELYIKIGLPIIAILVYFDVVNILEGIYILLGIYALNVLTLFIYISYIKEFHFKPNWSFLKQPIVEEMRTYALYGVLGSLGSILATRIDVVMVGMLASNDMKDVGVYVIAFFIANVISVPARSINNISAPVISESWKTNDIENIGLVYFKSSIVLLTIGVLVLVGIWSSIDDLFAVMPNGENYAIGKYVVLILGIGKLFDLLSGNSIHVIAYSKYFRFNFYAMLILAVINVISNYVFIPIYEINGAALATATSIFLYNLSKMVFIYLKIKMHPFSVKTIYILLIGIAVYGIGLLIPSVNIPIIDIIIRSIVIATLYISAVLYFNISSDITNLVFQSLNKVKSLFK